MIEHVSHLTGTAAIAFGLYLAADALAARVVNLSATQRRLIYAGAFGLIIAGCLTYSHELRPGVFTDARGAVLAVATIAGGYGVGAATAGVGMVVRTLKGGAGLEAGLASLGVEYLAAAALVWLWRKHQGTWAGQLTLLAACGLATGLLDAASLLWIGTPAHGLELLQSAGLELLVIQTFGTLLLGSLMHLQRAGRHARELVQAALANSMDGFALVDFQGRLLEVNPELERMTGRPRDELLRLRLDELAAGLPPGECAHRLQETRARGRLRTECRWQRQDGSALDLLTAASVAPERIGGVFLFFHDITSLKQQQEELRRLNRALFARSECDQALLRARDEGQFLNDACRILVDHGGYRLAWVGDVAPDAAPPLRAVAHAGAEPGGLTRLGDHGAADAPARDPLGTCLQTRQPAVLRPRADEPPMTPGPAAAAALPLLHGDTLLGVLLVGSGAPEAFDSHEVALLGALAGDLAFGLVMLRERAAREQAEAALRRTQALQRAILDNIPDPAWIKDREGRFLAVNQAWSRFAGLAAEQAVGQPDAAIFPAEIVATFRAEERALAASGQPTCTDQIVPDRRGNLHWFETFQAPLTESVVGLAGFLGIARDITGRKQVEDALRQSEQLHRSFIERLPDGVYRSTPEGRFLEVNPALVKLLGYGSREELLAVDIISQIYFDEQDRASALAEAAQTEMTTLRLRRKDGTEVWVEDHGRHIYDDRGAVKWHEGVLRDATARRRAEAALWQLNLELDQRVQERAAEALDLYQNAPCGYHSVGPDNVILQINDTELRWLGYAREEIVGRVRVLDLMTPESAARVAPLWRQLLADGQPLTWDADFRRKDGTVIAVLVHVGVVADAAGRFLRSRSAVLNVTERRRAEAALRETGTRLALATRTAGVGIWEFDATAGTLLWDEQMSRLYGRSAEPFTGTLQDWWDCFHPEDLPRCQAEVAAVIRGEKDLDIEFRVRWPDGTVRNLHGLAALQPRAGSDSVRLVGTNWDITSRTDAEQRLKRLVQLQQLLVEISGTYINLPLERVDASIQTSLRQLAGFVEADRVYVFDYDLEHLEGRCTYQWSAEGVEHQVASLLAASLDPHADWLALHQQGRPVVVPEVAAMPAGNLRELLEAQEVKSLLSLPLMDERECIGFVGFDALRQPHAYTTDEQQLLTVFGQMLVSIRRRQRAEQRLQAERQRLDGIIRGTNVGTWEWNMQTGEVVINERWAQTKGYTLAELEPLRIEQVRQLVHPDDLAANVGVLERHVRGEQEFYELEARMRHRDGSWVWVLEHGKVMAWTADGQPLLMQGTQQDISLRKAAEAALRASELKFRHLLEMAPMPMAVVNFAGEPEFLNEHFTHVLGYDLDDLPDLDTWWLKACPDPAYRAYAEGLWRAALRQHADGNTEMLNLPGDYELTDKQGGQHSMIVVGRVIDGRIVLTFQDITAVRRATHQLRKLSQAVEFSPTMIHIADALGRVDYVNPCWEAVTGWHLDEVRGRKPNMLKSGVHSRDFYAQLWGEITAGRVWRGEFCNRRKGGDLYWESAAIAPVRNDAGAITHYVAVKEDITARRQAAEELRLAKEAADAANRAKSAFLASMSHELRTPMNVVLGFTQLLLRDPDLHEPQRQRLTSITRSGEHLMDIIADILEMARIESGAVSLKVEAFDLHQMLDDLATLWAARAQAKGLQFRFRASAGLQRFVQADETKLRQVFFNLLGNAVKFTARGTITLAVTTLPEPEGALRLVGEVQDTGPGIAGEELAHLFEPFYQGAQGRQASGGTGLGLPISREFARLMGGDLTASSELGQGSTFRVNVQVQLADAAAVPPARIVDSHVVQLAPDFQGCLVLVAGGEAANRELLEHLLTPLGFVLRHADPAAAGEAGGGDFQPQLILVDLRLPVPEGCAAIRQMHLAHPQVPIIALSASVFAEDQSLALAAGAAAFLAQPFRQEDLLALIEQCAGVQYLYGPLPSGVRPLAPSSASEEPVSAGQIARLPADLVAALVAASRQAEYDLLLELLGRVAQQDASLARRLRLLVEQFDYARLQGLLRPDVN
jgi:PAS domain S-box-containing protein